MIRFPWATEVAHDKKTSTSEGKDGLDGPFEPTREEDSSRLANLQERAGARYA